MCYQFVNNLLHMKIASQAPNECIYYAIPLNTSVLEYASHYNYICKDFLVWNDGFYFHEMPTFEGNNTVHTAYHWLFAGKSLGEGLYLRQNCRR